MCRGVKLGSAIIMWLFTCVQVGVRAGIYHGAEALCDITSTRSESGSNPSWNQYLDFDLNMVDIPRMARICLVIYGVYVTTRKTRRRAKEVKIIAQHVNQFGHDKDLRFKVQGSFILHYLHKVYHRKKSIVTTHDYKIK